MQLFTLMGMSIVTKKGDQGQTALLFNRQVSKCHPLVEACGSLDELHSAIGLARAAVVQESIRKHLLQIQKDLIVIMGELTVLPEDQPRYRREGYPRLTPPMIQALDTLIREMENRQTTFQGWAYPGSNLSGAALDVARTTCRRAERRVCGLKENGLLANQDILIYINRLADALWLLGRWVEVHGSDSC